MTLTLAWRSYVPGNGLFAVGAPAGQPQRPNRGRAGLAANQIGSSLAAFSCNVDGHAGYLINPRAVELSGDLTGPEACTAQA